MKIIWTEKAVDSMDEILQYLTEYFGLAVSLSFYSQCMEVVESIHTYNDIGKRLEAKPVYRYFIIGKHTTLYYSIRSGAVYLHYFFNNRSNPESLRKMLDF